MTAATSPLPRYRRVVVLGGYGGVGRVLCRLLTEARVQVVVAGRRAEPAAALAAELEGATSAVADATDGASVAAAIEGADLLINATTRMEHGKTMAGASIAAGVDYLEMSLSRSLEELGAEAEARGVCVVDQAGFHPGLLAPVARVAAGALEEVEAVRIFMAMDANFVDPSSTWEIIDAVQQGRSRFWRDGAWVDATWRDSEKCDFGEPFGALDCFPLEMIEVREVARELGLKHAGVYAAGFNGFVDWVVMPLIMGAGKIRPGFARDSLARMLYWGCKTFSPNDRGVHMRTIAEGRVGGEACRRVVDVTHADEFHFTAAPVLAALRQLGDGGRRPGLHMMGLLVEPGRLLADLETLGLAVAQGTPSQA